MKTSALFLFLVMAITSFSQELDYCDYFSLNQSFTPSVPGAKKDKATEFFKKHPNRFEYILFKHVDEWKTLWKYYPDTDRVEKQFCETVIHSDQIKSYFSSLTPNTLVNWKAEKDTFTIDEMMLVASRFFYCDAVDQKDTTIQSHTCVGIHGQKELASTRDYTLLEAFSIEGIFYYLNKKKEPAFYRQFGDFKTSVAKEKLAEFTDFDSFLIEIRNQCYNYMQQNADLKEKLFNYYSMNRNNLNFEITR